MVKKPGRWEPGEATQAFLVALDISGFSRDPNPDRLFHLRHGFLHSVEKTRLLQRSHPHHVRVHFLGDELRIAFHVDVDVGAVRGFLVDLFAELKRINGSLPAAHQVRLRSVVLAGPVTWAQWHDCHFLDGPLPAKAQYWMGQLAPSEIAVDDSFKTYLDVGGLSTTSMPRLINGETAHLLSL